MQKKQNNNNKKNIKIENDNKLLFRVHQLIPPASNSINKQQISVHGKL